MALVTTAKLLGDYSGYMKVPSANQTDEDNAFKCYAILLMS